MNTLNLAYLLGIFQAVVQGTSQGSYAIVPADSEEVKALVKAKYIKTNKRLHNQDGNVGATLVDGATESDLRIDFEIPDFPVSGVAPAVEQTSAPDVGQETVPAPLFEAPVAPFTIQDEHATMNTQTHPVPTFEAPIIPQHEPVQLAVAEDVADVGTDTVVQFIGGAVAPVVDEDSVRKIGAGDHHVEKTVETRLGTVEIDVGIPYVMKLSAAQVKREKGTVEHYPFNDIAAVKIANPTTVPSFHVAGKSSKDMSSSVKRANARMEKDGKDIAFRVSTAQPDDPKGAGVRIFAFFNAEAPAVRSRRTTEDDAE